MTFQGHSLEELRREIAESIEDYLELCAEVGKDPERPYRGEFLIRTSPELHRAAAIEAEASGKSLNAWVEEAIAAVVEKRRPAPQRSRRAKAAKDTKKTTRRRSPG